MARPLDSLTALRKRADAAGWFRGRSLVYHGLGPVGAHMFYHFMPVSVIVSLYYGEEVARYMEGEWGTTVFSYEKMNGVRLNDSTDFHFNFYRDYGREIASCLAGLPGEVCFVPFAPSNAIHAFLFDHAVRCRLMQNSKIVQNYFEFKARLARVAPDIGVPMPPDSRVVAFDDLDYARLADAYEGGFVLQIPLSAAGSGTEFIFSEDDFNAFVESKRRQFGEAYGDTDVKVTPFLSGPSPNCTGCVVGGAVALSQPDIQIVGDPYFVSTPGQYIGSDFTVRAFSDDQKRLMLDVTRRIGEWMGRNGYRGNFGVDFLSTVDSNNRITDIYVSEVNARLVGESQYMADFQAMRDSVPLTFFHLAEWMDIREFTAADIDRYNKSLPDIEGSALILYSRDRGTFTAEGGITSGVYRFEEGALKRVRDGYLLSDTRDDDEFVITVGVPWKGLVIGHPRCGDHNIYLCYIITRRSIVDPGNYRIISERWRTIADTVYNALALTPCEPRALLKEREGKTVALGDGNQ